MTEKTIVTLANAGPITAMAIAFLAVALVTLLLAIILYRMLKAFLSVQQESVKQTKLTRKAIEKLDENHIIEIKKLTQTIEAINLSIAKRSVSDKREFHLLRRNMNRMMDTLDGFVPKVVAALSESMKEDGKNDEKITN